MAGLSGLKRTWSGNDMLQQGSGVVAVKSEAAKQMTSVTPRAAFPTAADVKNTVKVKESDSFDDDFEVLEFEGLSTPETKPTKRE